MVFLVITQNSLFFRTKDRSPIITNPALKMTPNHIRTFFDFRNRSRGASPVDDDGRGPVSEAKNGPIILIGFSKSAANEVMPARLPVVARPGRNDLRNFTAAGLQVEMRGRGDVTDKTLWIATEVCFYL